MSVDIGTIRKYISDARLQNYLDVSQNNYPKALKLYQANVRLSQSFYPLLSLVEVILRNALNEELSRHFNDADWLLNQVNGFMMDNALVYTDRTGKKKENFFLKSSVEKSMKNVPKPISQGKIIADLNFGFWTALFNVTHSRILKGIPMRIFVNLPKGFNRKKVCEILDKVRDFRNRVYHNEPIIFKMKDDGTVEFNLKKSELIYGYIKDFFSWFDLDFNLWTKRIDHVMYEIENAKCVMNYYPGKKYYMKRLYFDLIHFKDIHS